MKILFIIKKRISYNNKVVSFGLINSSKFVCEAINKLKNIEAKVVDVVDNNCIDREVSQYKPDIVIIEALWVVPEKFKVLINLHKNVKWIIRLHSKPSFIANEGIAFPWINEYIKIGKETGKLFLSPNNLEFTKHLENIYNYKHYYTPNIYPDVYRKIEPTFKNPANEIHIGCFGAIRPMKNHLPQAMAAMIFAKHLNKKLYFHINDDRTEQNGENVLKNLKALFLNSENSELVGHPWQQHSDFLELINQMDFGMQVSLTETYNIVAADFVSMRKPILISKEIDWAPIVCRSNPNSIDSMVSGLHRLNFIKGNMLSSFAQYRLKQSNDQAINSWAELLNNLNDCDNNS